MHFTFDPPRCRENAERVHALSADLKRIADLQAPGIRDFIDAPIIDDWFIGYRLEPALVGRVAGHPLIIDGPITTSGLHYLDTTAQFARTFTRWYRIGRPRG